MNTCVTVFHYTGKKIGTFWSGHDISVACTKKVKGLLRNIRFYSEHKMPPARLPACCTEPTFLFSFSRIPPFFTMSES
jgi:hypothetical protein